MSKAFTREDDNLKDDDSLPDDGPVLPQGVKNYITPAGANRLRDELKKLLDEERPKIVETVTWAASNGDRSENADYIYGKRRLREIDRRIRFLSKRLEAAEIIDPEAQRSERVVFGATVKVKDEAGNPKTYSIVGIDETDVKRGRISWISPVGKALLRSRVGDYVTIHTPRGEEELEVVAIEFVALD
jgi:transcription elongation factor GreB